MTQNILFDIIELTGKARPDTKVELKIGVIDNDAEIRIECTGIFEEKTELLMRERISRENESEVLSGIYMRLHNEYGQ